MKKSLIGVFFVLLFLPVAVFAQENINAGDNIGEPVTTEKEGLQSPNVDINQLKEQVAQEESFEAKIIEILEEKKSPQGDGWEIVSQKMRLEGLTGKWKGQEFVSEEVEIDPIIGHAFKKGDRVAVSAGHNAEGQDTFYVTDFIRRGKLYLMAAIFFAIILLIGRWRGFRAILGLAFSFFVILNFIIPKILGGANPLYVSLVYSLPIVVAGTYLVYGLNKKSSISILGISLSVVLTGLISVAFTGLCRLSGFAQEETLFITSLTEGALDLRGLLLAGFIIGALGVLDDLAISQVSTVQELKNANQNLSRREIYKRAMRVGVDHISSMVNTLFLAYAGAALPLLLLFTFKQPPFETFGQVLNHEVIATEIVRALVGSIGLALAVPLSTFLAAYFYGKKKTSAPASNS